MKKTAYILCAFAALALSSCEMFQMDNMEGPDAQISGRLVDAVTGDNIQIELVNQEGGMDWSSWPPSFIEGKKHGTLVVTELGWEATEEQFWYVKFDGSYTNNLVFAGEYSVSSKFLPCYEINETFTVKKGSNTKDFQMLPFGRVKDLSFSYDTASRKIRATFTPEVSDPTKAGTIARAILCCNTSNFVGSYFNLCAQDPGASATMVTPGQPVTLEIDTTLPANNEEFKYERTHFLRVGIQVQGPGFNSNNLYNFSPVYTATKDFSKFEKYVWPTE